MADNESRTDGGIPEENVQLSTTDRREAAADRVTREEAVYRALNWVSAREKTDDIKS